ncbi:MAG: putative metal-binding motif-containing protein, partial [Fimbriimonadaceae bacterium]|nr:putative metal-binding motif-containing protein [Chitinophagales bacterium]
MTYKNIFLSILFITGVHYKYSAAQTYTAMQGMNADIFLNSKIVSEEHAVREYPGQAHDIADIEFSGNEMYTQYRYYRDNDYDGYGDISESILAYTQPEDYVNDNTDCNDNDILINKAIPEVCNRIDDNCDGIAD